jgi:hypothetical protein
MISWTEINEKLNSVHVPLGVLVLAVVGGFYSWAMLKSWHLNTFITHAEAKELTLRDRSLETQIKDNTELLTSHIHDYRITAATNSLRQIENQQFNLEAYVRENGEDEMTIQRRAELDAQYTEVKAYRDCILNGASHCDSLPH